MQAGTIGERLREIRARRSRKEFAALYGVHERTLIRYENDSRHPDMKFLQLIISGEKIEEKWLFTGEGAKHKNMLPVPDSEKEKEEKRKSADMADLEKKHQPSHTGCQRCLELYEKLVQAQQEATQELKQLVQAREREISLLKANAALQARNKELAARLSLSADEEDESPQAITA